MITPNEFRNGSLIKYNGEVFVVLSYSRSRTAQRRARVLARIRNVRTGSVIEESFESEAKFEEAEREERKCQYMYKDDLGYHFMDLEHYDQFCLGPEIVSERSQLLTEGQEVTVVYVDGRAVDVEPPMFVVLEVVDTPPEYRGDTATGGGKPAKLSTGLVVNVPFFVKNGDKVKVDTRTNAYVERA